MLRLPENGILWAVLVLIASVGLSTVSYKTWNKFQHPSVVTTVLTTRNDCSNLPFPSFTVCDTSRVDWQKALQLTTKDIPNLQKGSMEKILILLKALADISFGDFDFLETMIAENLTSTDFEQLDIPNLLQKVQRSCSQVFISCWWRENYFNCCSFFEVQRTDMGFCYSFNSDVSDASESLSCGYGKVKDNNHKNYWVDWNKVVRPRRAVTSGPWNGLLIEVRVMAPEQLPVGTNITSGVTFYLEETRSFPNSESQHVNPGSFVNVRINSITLQAQPYVRSLDLEDRKCLFLDERPGWNGVYKEQNCYAECHREYTMKLCNCSPSFLFLDSSNIKYPPCDLGGLFCLKENNNVFNTLAPHEGQEVFFGNLKNAMKCDCPPDCTSHHYIFDTSISQIPDQNIVFDVHYRDQNHNIVFMSDASFNAMGFLVTLGGVAGLFLGGSLISGVELMYFFTFRFFYHWKKSRRVHHIPQTSVKHVYPYYN